MPDRLADLLRFFHGLRVGPDRVVAPLEEAGKVALRQPHQRDEERRRERRREVLVEVARAGVDEAVDDLVDELAHLGLDLAHLLRREERVEQPAVLGVVGRVDGERDERHLVADLDDIFRREDLGMLERPHDVLVARQPDAVAEDAGRAGHGTLRLEILVRRDRILRGVGREQHLHRVDVNRLIGAIASVTRRNIV